MTCLVLWVALAGTGQTNALEDPKVAAQLEKLARELLEAHNAERAVHKLPPLTLDPRLSLAAKHHAHDMAQHKNMSHEGSDKSQAADRVKKQKYRYVTVGENVAVGQKDVRRVVEAWMDSPGHRKNILGDFTQMGAAVFKDDDGAPYWCVDFGTPIPKLVPEIAAKDALELINKEREAAEKPKFAASSKLNQAALNAAKDLAKRKNVEAKEEDSPDYAKQAGYRYDTIAQAGAAGAPTAKDLVDHLFKDEGQKEHLLDDYKEVGIGYAQDDEETPYWVVILAKPRRVGR